MRNRMIVNMLQNNTKRCAGRASLSGLARFCAIMLLFLLNSMPSAYSQTQDWPANLKPVFWTQNARCGTDGMVFYALLYSEDNGLTFDTVGAPGKKTVTQLDLEHVRVYKKLNRSDSALHASRDYHGRVDTFVVGLARTYYIALEGAVINTTIRYATPDSLSITVPTDYIHVQSPAIVEVATTENGYGKRPSLVCEPTGREQLKIIGGRYPFQVHVDSARTLDLDSSAVYKEFTLTGPQNHGLDSLQWDYEHYLTIDSLPAYTWLFQVADSCRNTGQYAVQVIGSVQPPVPNYIEVRSKPPHDNDSNIVQINLILKNSQYEYYLKDAVENMKYKFYWKGCSVPTKFKKLKYEEVHSRDGGVTKYFVISDTLCGHNTYKNILCMGPNVNRTFHFELYYDSCGTEMPFIREFELEKPNENYFDTVIHFVLDSITSDGYCQNVQSGHDDYFKINYRGDGGQHNTKNHEDNIHRYHFTYPLVWEFAVDDGGEDRVVNRETVTNIHNAAYLYAQNVIDSLEDVTGLPIHNRSLSVTLTDAKGCVLYKRQNIALNYDTSSTVKETKWTVTRKSGDNCCVDDCVITLKEENTPLKRPLGDVTVSLISSPYENLYNFSAVYDPIEMVWQEPVKEDYMNIANIVTSVENGSAQLEIRQPCLPSGIYSFKIISQGCGRMDTTVTFRFNDVYTTEIVSEVHHNETRRCAFLQVVYDGGEANLVKQSTDLGNGADLDPVVIPCNTQIKVVKGEAGGYTKNAVYGLNEPIELTQPGMYILEIKPVPTSGSLCESQVFPYDTIYHTTSSSIHEYAEALLCQNNDTEGNVYVKAIDGAEPYTYTLYSESELHGEILGSNHDGIFLDVPFDRTDTLSCMISDDCASSNSLDIIPEVLANLQKVWFDNGGSEIELCEGQSVHVNALQYGNVFHFQWWYDHDVQGHHDTLTVSTDASPDLFLQHGTQSGWYHVNIVNTGCYERVEDSVYVKVRPAPSVLIAKDTTLCPNKPVTLTFTPQKSYIDSVAYNPDIHFSIAFSNANGIEVEEFTGKHGVSIAREYTFVSDTKVYPVSIEEEGEGSCGPYLAADPEDTVFVTMAVQHMFNMASVIATDTTICYGGNASLRAKVNASQLGVDNIGNTDFTFNWYKDFAQTQLWKTDMNVQGENWTIFHDTTDIVQQTAFFISVDGVEGKCPTTNGFPNATINFGDEEDTELDNVTVYRFFDSGGEDGNYATGELKTHTFYTMDGSRVLLHFNSIELSSVSQLYVFSGPYTRADSLLFQCGKDDNFPDYILSKSNRMTIGFRADKQSAPGWDALIQHAPGIAVADVRPQSITTFKATLCRVDAAGTGTCYPDYPYRDIMSNVRDISDISGYLGDNMDDIVWNAMGQPGTHIFTGYPIAIGGAHLQDIHGCDSIVRYELTVRKPSIDDTTAVITSVDSLVWRGGVYRESGDYQLVITDNECGCDTVVELHLIVLETDIEPMDSTVCCGDSVTLVIHDIKTPDVLSSGTLRPAIGDVLCSTLYDGGTMMVLPPDTFIARVEAGEDLYPIGVVFDIEVDVDGVSGRVIALKDACDTVCQYAVGGTNNSPSYEKITTTSYNSGISATGTDVKKALLDLQGEKNTLALKKCCENVFPQENPYQAFMQHAPAAATCYYYDHKSCYRGSTLPTTGTRDLGWYLPAAGELYRYFIRRDIVNATLKLLKEHGYGAKLPYEDMGNLQGAQLSQLGIKTNHSGKNTDTHEMDCKYHTSTEISAKGVNRLDYKGMLNNNDKHPKKMNETRLEIPTYNLDLTVQYQGDNIGSSYSYYIHRARAIKKFTIYNE